MDLALLSQLLLLICPTLPNGRSAKHFANAIAIAIAFPRLSLFL